MSDQFRFTWVAKEGSAEATQRALAGVGVEVSPSPLPDPDSSDIDTRLALEAAGLHFDQQDNAEITVMPEVLLEGAVTRASVATAVAELVNQGEVGALILSWQDGVLRVAETRALSGMVVMMDGNARQLPPEVNAIEAALNAQDA